ncbi:MAG: hypothetical protein CM1200mP17_14130 [Woeseia sp.]|nr:MAG: hypothetical protein CM1200mP17_14130 [Woeseia sp.]
MMVFKRNCLPSGIPGFVIQAGGFTVDLEEKETLPRLLMNLEMG